ncbi:MAG: VCBS repeat-containing protein [Deltaproteobacteria bacterium]|nr:VCBS repeat-containing protein [Deltaproteobacteria bacterium]MBN2686892.1 VCBS repeat-containing protein [Deltaproteobacteria bacterium]
MKKVITFFLCAAMALSIAGTARAADVKTIAVLPFSVHSAEAIDYVRNGVWDMLMSRLSSSDQTAVISKNAVVESLGKTGGKELSADEVSRIGKALKADYVVWGSITKIGSSVSLDGRLFDVAAGTSPVGVFEQCRGLDEIIPKMDVFAKKIQYHLLGTIPTTVIPTAEPAPVTAQPRPEGRQPAPGSSAVEALRTRQGTLTAVINPDFINAARPLDRKDFWMTQRYPIEFKGMDIGDVNNDGKNEIVIIDGTSVIIYQREGTTLKQLHKRSGGSSDNNIAVDVADINSNGVPEIIVTAFVNNALQSFVLEFDGKEYATIAEGLEWFLRVIPTAEGPLLIGQARGLDSAFENPIYEIRWRDGKYVEGPRMPIPQGLSVYGLTIDTVDPTGKDVIIALDEYDHIRIYEKTEKPLSKIEIFGGSDELVWKSDEVFGGSSNAIDLRTPGASSSSNWADEKGKTYINVRILTYDINGDGRKEIIIVKNLSSSGRLFKNVKSFSKSEIYDLEFDGLGFVQNWKTRPIQGYVSDYHFKDVDNDGKNEIVLALVLGTGMTRPRSVVVAYDLKVQQ